MSAVDEAAAALAYATLNDPTQPPPPFAPERHAAYLKRVAADAGALEYALTEYMRVSGVYWGLTAMRLLGRDAAAELGGPALVELARGCQNADGGFGGARGHDSHVLYTLSALQVLALLGALDRCDRAAAAAYVAALQQPDGSFCGDRWGEVDTRFSYCALAALALLGRLGDADVGRAAAFVDACRNFDGGYGCAPGAESHAGQVFCCVGALAIARRLDLVDRPLLCWWLAERQCDSGGSTGGRRSRPASATRGGSSRCCACSARTTGSTARGSGASSSSARTCRTAASRTGRATAPTSFPHVLRRRRALAAGRAARGPAGHRRRLRAARGRRRSLGLEAQTRRGTTPPLLDAWAAERRGGGARGPNGWRCAYWTTTT